MKAFLDFEASSLEKGGFPVEVGWVLEDGTEEAHLIRPAPDWTVWSAEAEAIHHLSRSRLEAEGEVPDAVAARMMEALSGHEILASAPSWDGQWLSRLLRAGGLPRHALRLGDTDAAEEAEAERILREAGLPVAERATQVRRIVEEARQADEALGPAEHRALADARRSRRLFEAVRQGARAMAEQHQAARTAQG
ncbi:transcriptional regulator [Roseomonas gilardii subsp. gilardii]|uniref:transcriptional regulator n=1 Tax=Roseomonas gilardii TaxID=257708 RepID=UPI001FFA6E09|nr:transcriptional regulator [Roseomonas gilardii]UPG72693.1 transcriptional regulator [Roseomonas gilardii subsp. gilardii]